MSLFRAEVSDHQSARLHGQVLFSVPLSTRLMVGGLFGFIAAVGVWLSSATYARMETVLGLLTTNVPSAKVIASQTGVVTKLHAVEGQLVRAGDRLAIINLDRRSSVGEAVTGRSLDALKARRTLVISQGGLSTQREAAERGRLEAIIAASQQQALHLREQIALQQEVVRSNQTLYDQISSVVERGFVSKIEFERRRQTLLNSQQQLSSLQQQLSVRLGDAQQAQSQASGLVAEFAQGKLEIESNLHAMEQQRAQLDAEQGYVVIAPISGRVTALQVAEGRTVNATLPLMLIVPESSLRAELYAPTRAIGFVKPGQETRILYDAFPYQRFGSFGGKVQSVSRIVIDPREAEVPLKLEEPVYRITVIIDKQMVSAYGENVSLQPGMTLRANIVLERQSFLQWLLQPLNAVLKRSA